MGKIFENNNKIITINKVLIVFEKLMQVDSKKIREMTINKFYKVYEENEF